MPFNLGFGEILVVLIVALLVFGGRLPQMGRSLGQGLREFKKGVKGMATPPDPGETGSSSAAASPSLLPPPEEEEVVDAELPREMEGRGNGDESTAAPDRPHPAP